MAGQQLAASRGALIFLLLGSSKLAAATPVPATSAVSKDEVPAVVTLQAEATK